MTQTLLKSAADFDTQLAAPVAIGDTTATLVTATDDDSVALASGKYGFTVDNGNSKKEYFVCDLSGTALTNIQSVTRQGAVSTGFARSHRRGAKILITDWVLLKRMLSVLDGTTDLDASTPLKYDGTASITTANQLATKAYVDSVALVSAPNADLTTKGVVEIATTAEIDAGTATGGTGASIVVRPDQLALSIYGTRLPSAAQKAGLASTTTPAAGNLYQTQADFQKATETYAADSVGSDSYAITLSPAISAYANGMVFRFKAGTANTGAATLNINGLGAKAIVKRYNVALATGDIVAGQIVEVQYESVGDNFQMLSPVAKAPSVLGSAVSRTWGTIYQAATDCFVVAYFTGDGGVGISANIVSDSSATPSTVRSRYSSSGSGPTGSMSTPVKAGDYYQVATVSGTPTGTTVYEYPLS